MQAVLSCALLHPGWLLLPLLAVVATLSARHRVNRPRLAASCAALCAAAYFVHSCQTGAAATSRSPAETPAAEEDDLVQSLVVLQVCLCAEIIWLQLAAALLSCRSSCWRSTGSVATVSSHTGFVECSNAVLIWARFGTTFTRCLRWSNRQSIDRPQCKRRGCCHLPPRCPALLLWER